MIRTLTLAALVAGLAFPVAAQEAPRWTIAIHGGAGTIERGQMTPERDAEYRAALTAAVEAGAEVLRNGGSSLDAVQAAIELMEDDPLFNAGRGAVFTADGTIALDASIMNGETMEAGAVASVSRTRHPIALARAVMEQSGHVLLAEEGADAFAAHVGLEQVDPSFFFTQRRWDQLIEVLTARGLTLPEWPTGVPQAVSAVRDPDDHQFGTVGVVAVDSQGHIAAGTSTGGTTAKQWGRVGDTPIIGAGNWAGHGCAVSGTGTGEYFIRLTVARDVCAMVQYTDVPIQQAADTVVSDLAALREGSGGVIALTADGSVAFSMNTSGMYRGWANQDTAPQVAIYADEVLVTPARAP
ncbi:MAG: isoaspartyl peptidase/L-asparaginase [Caulobacterales bacterium]|nr:isoaspartyl peptidase/L-asparaginase [Caulobacterales bacterium]